MSVTRRDAIAVMAAAAVGPMMPVADVEEHPGTPYKGPVVLTKANDLINFKADILKSVVKLDYEGRLHWFRPPYGQFEWIIFSLDWENKGTFHVSHYTMELDHFHESKLDDLKEEIQSMMNFELEDYIFAVKKVPHG
jgi:hypothetical protein